MSMSPLTHAPIPDEWVVVSTIANIVVIASSCICDDDYCGWSGVLYAEHIVCNNNEHGLAATAEYRQFVSTR